MSEQSWSTCGLCNTKTHTSAFHEKTLTPLVGEAAKHDQRLTKSRDVLTLVMADYESRIRFGEKKYGEALQIDNLRDHLRDAYEEALDQTGYLRAALVLWEEMRTAMQQIYAIAQFDTLARRELMQRLWDISKLALPYQSDVPRNGADVPGSAATS